MGIVVCIAMLLGLLQLELKQTDSVQRCAPIVSLLLMLLGVWNALWYGLQHLSQFWGQAALVSGVAMILAAIIIAGGANLKFSSDFVYKRVRPFRLPIVISLAASFLLYSISLVQLNLGLPIFR